MNASTRRCGTMAEADETEPVEAAPSVDDVALYLRGWEDAMDRAAAIITHAATVTHPSVALRILFQTSLSAEEAVGLLDQLAAGGATAGQAGQTPALGHTNATELPANG